jgi:pilus assembly protein Flp/PilA
MLKRFLKDERGATAVEYGLIAGLISIALVTGATSLGSSLNAKFEAIGTKVGSGL